MPRRRPGQADNMILRAVGRRTVASVAELARTVGLARTTLRRALARLLDSGQLRQGAKVGRYGITWEAHCPKNQRRGRGRWCLTLGDRDALFEAVDGIAFGIACRWYQTKSLDWRFYVNLPDGLRHKARLYWGMSPAGPALNIHAKTKDHKQPIDPGLTAMWFSEADYWARRIGPVVNRWWKAITKAA